MRTWLFVTLLVGCGTNLEYAQLNAPPHPMVARAPETVELFMAQRPARPYTEVATIESRQQSEFSEDDKQAIINKMRVEAANRGCDGLVIVGRNDATVVSGDRNSVSSANLAGYRATCIVYNDGGMAGAPPMAPPPAAPPAAEPAAGGY